MTALELARQHGADLVGRLVWTQPFGGWPGGAARVIQMYPDEDDRMIVYQAQSVASGDEVGIFWFENAKLL